jgi:hypothetical protein
MTARARPRKAARDAISTQGETRAALNSGGYSTDYSDTSSDDTDSGYTSDNPARQRCLDGLADVMSWEDLDSTLASQDCGE